MEGLIILGACCVLNLAATGSFEEILRGLPYRFHVGSRARREVQWLRFPGLHERGRVDLTRLFERGLLLEESLQHPQEEAEYVELSQVLDDQEAEAAALAVTRSYALATDDRKVRRVVSERSGPLFLCTTLEIVRAWQVCSAVSDLVLG